jgi:GNAT superfamily N-acetyltransferase
MTSGDNPVCICRGLGETKIADEIFFGRSMKLRYRFLNPSDICLYHDQIIQVYREAFAEPPYRKGEPEVTEFALSLDAHLAMDGFRFLTACQENPCQIVGFAYGRAVLPGSFWYATVEANLDPPAQSRWLQDSFQFAELAVTPAFQANGIGGALHDRLLGGIVYKTALLTTIDADTRASRLYADRGWQLIQDSIEVPGLPRLYRLMGLKIQ